MAFILIIALDKPMLATKVSGHTISLREPIGFGLIFASVVVIGMITALANGRFDPSMKISLEDAAK